MVRVKGGNITRKHRKKILNLAKGFRGSHSKIFKMANEQVMKALKYSYVGRKHKKKQFRKLWITRINATVRKENNINYSTFINKIKIEKIKLNRKMLAQIAILDNITFKQIIA
jgi:large subunit ribosomal protein L20